MEFGGTQILNAKIKFSYLGFDAEKKELQLYIGFDTTSGFYKTKICKVSSDLISDILNILELSSWEELSRKFARIKINDRGVVTAIGNIIEDRWITL